MRAMLPGFQAAGVDVVLVYSVRSPVEAAFGAEFAAAAAAGGVRVIYTVTGAQGPELHVYASFPAGLRVTAEETSVACVAAACVALLQR